MRYMKTKKILTLLIVGVFLVSSLSVVTANKKIDLINHSPYSEKVYTRSTSAITLLNQENKFPIIDLILQKIKLLLERLIDLISQVSSDNQQNDNNTSDNTDKNNNDNPPGDNGDDIDDNNGSNNNNPPEDDRDNTGNDNEPDTNVNIVFEKRVRKKDSNVWEKHVNIMRGEEIEFGLTIYNLNKLLQNYEKVEGIITDILPPNLLYNDSAYFLIGKGETWIFAGYLTPVVTPSISADKGETVTFRWAPLESTSLIETRVFSDAVQQMPDWEHGMIVFSSKATQTQTGYGTNIAYLRAEFDGTQVELQDTATVKIR